MPSTLATFKNWSQETPKLRANILKMIHQAGSGHPGGSLSMVEILMTLYGKNGVLRHNPEAKQSDLNRDRFVLSKGHGVPALYAIMAQFGYGISEEELMTLRQLNSRMQGHPDRVRFHPVEASTGSLGQGASIAQGMAMALKMENSEYRVYSLVGDGEMQEGQIWEVALSAPHHKLSNLTLILDYNKGQIDGPTEEVLDLGTLKEKWEAFGWHVQEVNGHKYAELDSALRDHHPSRPHMVIAHTVKGKGVSFMEGKIGWHGKAPSDEELTLALEETAKAAPIGL